MKCINKNLEPIKELLRDFKEPVLSKILDTFPDDYIPTKEEALEKYNELLGNKVDYSLKVINALQSDKVRQPNKNFQGFLNDLQKQGVPKEQLQILQQEYKEGDSKEDLAIRLASNYAFSVEINTAKQEGYREWDKFRNQPNFEYNGAFYEVKSMVPSGEVDSRGFEYPDIDFYYKDGKEISEKEYEDALNNLAKSKNLNTQYYSNLTVPGGTNGSYREQNFETPLIKVPKSHAQFNTENTIGFSRNDDRQIYTEKDVNSLLEIMQKSGILEIKC